jgi:hypothetical protein
MIARDHSARPAGTQPTLTTARFLLRPFVVSDAHDVNASRAPAEPGASDR